MVGQQQEALITEPRRVDIFKGSNLTTHRAPSLPPCPSPAYYLGRLDKGVSFSGSHLPAHTLGAG